MILDIFKQNLPKNIEQEILKTVSPLVKDEDLYLAQNAIEILIIVIDINPGDSAQCNDLLNNCVEFSKSSVVRGTVLDKLTELFTLITVSEIIDTTSILDRLMDNIKKPSLVSTALCITAVLKKIQSIINPYLPRFIENVKLFY